MALDGEGRPSFQALQHRTSRTGHVLVYYAFGLLQLEDVDLTREPLSRRRESLQKVVDSSRVLLSEPLPGSPTAIERELRRLDLEGAVAKRVDSKYEPGERSEAWLKVKFQLAQEFVIGGFTLDGDCVDALVVGYRTASMAAGVRGSPPKTWRRIGVHRYPVIDGYVVPDDPSLLVGTNAQAAVPLIIGHNTAEGLFFARDAVTTVSAYRGFVVRSFPPDSWTRSLPDIQRRATPTRRLPNCVCSPTSASSRRRH